MTENLGDEVFDGAAEIFGEVINEVRNQYKGSKLFRKPEVNLDEAAYALQNELTVSDMQALYTKYPDVMDTVIEKIQRRMR